MLTSRRSGRYFKTFLDPMASFSQSISPFRAAATPFIPKNMISVILSTLKSCFVHLGGCICLTRTPARPAGHPAGRATSENALEATCTDRLAMSKVSILEKMDPCPTCRVSGRTGKAGRRVRCPSRSGPRSGTRTQGGAGPKMAQGPSGPRAQVEPKPKPDPGLELFDFIK